MPASASSSATSTPPSGGTWRKKAATFSSSAIPIGPWIERRDGILLVNPGEAGGWLRGKSTVALLDPAALTAEIIAL